MNIYQKLQTARVELQNMELKKTGRNQSIAYFELGDFLPAVNKLCEKHGLLTRLNIISGEKETTVLTIYNSQDPREKIEFVSPTANAQLPRGQEIQNLGAKITYLRRYMLITAFEIVESDIVEKVNEQTKDDLSEEDIDAIMSSKTLQELVKVCGGLTKTRKRNSVTKLYEERKKQIVGGEK